MTRILTLPGGYVHTRHDLASRLGDAASAVETDYWTDGINLRVPKAGTAARREWDRKFDALVHETFERDGYVLVPETFTCAELTRTNRIANPDRAEMYRLMAEAGEELPPIVVDDGMYRYIRDGNHRTWAACKAGRTEIKGYRRVRA